MVSLLTHCSNAPTNARSPMDLIAQLARELDLKVTDVDAAVKLIDEGKTIPFIAR